MILLDTNYLIPALIPGTTENARVQAWLVNVVALRTSVMVWAELLCGPVTDQQLAFARAMVGAPQPLTPDDAERAAELFNGTGRRRHSLSDCLIAATCLRLSIPLATNNLDDFRRFEPFGLKLAT